MEYVNELKHIGFIVCRCCKMDGKTKEGFAGQASDSISSVYYELVQ